jgi:hypothetical protein
MKKAGDGGIGFVALLESSDGGMMSSLTKLHEAHASMAPDFGPGEITRLGFSEARRGVDPSGNEALLFAANQRDNNLDGGSFDRVMAAADTGAGLSRGRESGEIGPEVAPEVPSELAPRRQRAA